MPATLPAPLRSHTRFAQKASRVPLAAFCGAVAAAIAVTVLVGWHTHLTPLVRFFPFSVPMQYNGALCVLMMGIGLWGLAYGKRALSGILGAVTAVFTGAMVYQYLAGVDLGIDQLLFRPYITFAGLPPGRSAPNAVLAGFLVGSSLVLFSVRWRGVPPLSGLLAAGVCVLSGAALAGYCFDLASIYGWGNWVRTPLHGAVALLLLGIGLLSILRQRIADFASYRARWLPALAGIGAMWLTLLLWQAIRADGRRQFQQDLALQTLRTRNEIRRDLELYGGGFTRAAQRWSYSWNRSASARGVESALLLRGFPSLVAVGWTEDGRQLAGVIPPERNIELTDQLPQLAVRFRTDSDLVQWLDAGAGRVLAGAPFESGSENSGFIFGLVDSQGLLSNLWKRLDESESYGILVTDGSHELFSAGNVQNGRRAAGERLDLAGLHWQVWLFPQKAAVNSGLPALTLAVGTFLAVLLFQAVRLGQIAGQKEALALAANTELSQEVRRREAAEQIQTQQNRLLEENNRTLVNHERALHHALEEVKQSRVQLEELAAIAEFSQDAIIGKDLNGIIKAWNKGAENIYGYPAAEIIGQSVVKLVPPQEAQHVLAQNERVKKGETLQNLEEVRVRKDGRPMEVSLTLSPIRDASGAVVGISSVCRDITASKRAEEALRQSLQEKEVPLQEVHHRVKNNMQVISSLLQLQAHHVDDPKLLKAFQESRGRIRSMALIHEKLYRSHNLAQVRFQDYAESLVADIVRSYCTAASAPRVELNMGTIEFDLDTAIPLGLLVNELVSNSVKHAFPEGRPGKISVRLAAEPENFYTLQVEDDGRGFPMPRPETKASFGLRLIEILSQQLGGKSEFGEGQGVCFRLVFPVQHGPASVTKTMAMDS